MAVAGLTGGFALLLVGAELLVGAASRLALVAPLAVPPQLVRFDIPVTISAALLTFLWSLDGRLGRGEGALLALILWPTWSGSCGPDTSTPRCRGQGRSGRRRRRRRRGRRVVLPLALVTLIIDVAIRQRRRRHGTINDR